ncbi:MAG TPA: exonuclease [Candidatus Altiarchaeales archaeon]|nr:exonuclease [Candidatus Altiarchaeales archaeon]
MLEKTFQHIPGVGEKTEEDLWSQGCDSWQRYLENPGDFIVSPLHRKRLHAGVLESKCRLEEFDHEYFRRLLGTSLSWRAYNQFKDHACYLDIETTGLSPRDSHVTTVCLHSSRETKNYVLGENLNELKSDLQDYGYIVTFNGARFDLPFLRAKLAIPFPHIHLDLMQALHRLGYRGGLKYIEKQMGIRRETDGVGGLDAIHLWNAYRYGTTAEILGEKVRGKEALSLLIQYNREDTVNLVELAENTVKLLENTLKTK